MEKKVTKKEMYRNLYTVVETANCENKLDLLGFIDHEIELLEKKSSKVSMTATQKANLEILDTLRTILEDEENPVTIGELLKHPELKDYTNQKISALMKKLVDGGEVEKTQVKKVSYFAIKH